MRKAYMQTRSLFVYSSRFKPALALLACLALPVCAAAQQRITGTVTDNQTHSPGRAATVRLEGGLFTMPSATTTDADGRFSFSGLSPNRYTLRVTADAFYAQAVTVTLAPREASQVDFQLV